MAPLLSHIPFDMTYEGTFTQDCLPLTRFCLANHGTVGTIESNRLTCPNNVEISIGKDEQTLVSLWRLNGSEEFLEYLLILLECL